jgi:hypothetical protein
MKVEKILILFFACFPIIASAHPGHVASSLHLHVGAPSAPTGFDPSMIAAGLLMGSILVASRLHKRP